MLFSEIVGALVLTLWYWVMSLRFRSRGGDYGEPEPQMHDEHLDMQELDHGGHDEHAAHDDHGHKGH